MKYNLLIETEDSEAVRLITMIPEMISAISDAKELIRKRCKHYDITDEEHAFLDNVREVLNQVQFD